MTGNPGSVSQVEPSHTSPTYQPTAHARLDDSAQTAWRALSVATSS